MTKKNQTTHPSEAPMLRIWLCGPLHIEWADPTTGQVSAFTEQDIRGTDATQALSLLKVLLCQPGRQAHRDWIMEQFWPEHAHSVAVHRFHNIISAFRKLLCPPDGMSLLPPITGKKDSSSQYTLPAYPRLWVDSDAALWNVEQAVRMERFGDDPFPFWQRACDLLKRGPFLADEPYAAWANERRELLEGCYRQCVHALWRLSIERHGRGGNAEALLLLRTYWQQHKTDEDILRPLMEVLGEQERYQEAEEYYTQLLHALAELDNEDGQSPREPDARTRDIRAYLQTKQIQREPKKEDHLINSQQGAFSEFVLPQAIPEFFGRSVIALPLSSVQQNNHLETRIPDCSTKFGLTLAHMITLVGHWYGMALFCPLLQDQLDRHIRALDLLKEQYSLEAFTLSRRSFLITLAALPTAALTGSKQAHKMVLKLEEFLPQCAASITSCWHLSGGSNLDAITPIIDSYLPTLITLMKTVSSYREVIADLVAQCYFLKTILSWHVDGLEIAEAHCCQALQYSVIAKNTNLKLTALNQHALIAYYAKQFSKALSKSEEALATLQHASHEQVFPIVQGRVSMYLAAIQAQQASGDAEQTLEHAQNRFALQASAEPVPLYADCGKAPLTLWDGLTHYHLCAREPGHAERALTSLKAFGRLQPDMNIPERFRLECLNNRILAAIECNEMEEAIMCLEAGKQGAEALESKQRNAEVAYAYREMLRRWPGEKRV